MSLEEMQTHRIAQSKNQLATFLESNPLTWTDGKSYTVTEEKQTLLMGSIAAYQIEVAINPNATVSWNAAGEECVEWDFTELCKLAVAIKNYVHALVAYQQQREVKIMACTTEEEAQAVVVDYDSVQCIRDYLNYAPPPTDDEDYSDEIITDDSDSGESEQDSAGDDSGSEDTGTGESESDTTEDTDTTDGEDAGEGTK